MHAEKFLHTLLAPVMHAKRLSTMTHMVKAALTGKRLSVTSLGRELDVPAKEKSNIQRADRFIGNPKLHQEKIKIYRVITHQLFSYDIRPYIVVDWTNMPNCTHACLRASVAADGRSIPIYEEVHRQKKVGNSLVHKKFLKQLKSLLPENCCPILITDAGFHNPWFKAVLALNWDYVGRIRGCKFYRFLDSSLWESCKSLQPNRAKKLTSIGEVELTKENGLVTNLYVIKESKGRYRRKKRSGKANDYARSSQEGWILASSLHHGEEVLKSYKKRMQIEENFRDLKSSQYGLSFEQCQSKDIKRLENLLLISTVAYFVAWLTGFIAEKLNLHFAFQANTTKSHRVLSLFFLGCQIIRKKIEVPLEEWFSSLRFEVSYVFIS